MYPTIGDTILRRLVAALEKFDPERDTEPEGWYRNPNTGRRRPDGDPTKEYVAR